MQRGGKQGRDVTEDLAEELQEALVGLTLGGRPQHASTPPAHRSEEREGPSGEQAAERLGGGGSAGAAQAAGIVIGGRAFSGFQQARQYILDLKQRRLDELITPADPDWPFLSALLARHPRAGAALQPHPRCPPVRAFVARRHAGRQGQTELHYIDASGEEDDFSALKCIRGGSLEADDRRRLLEAMADAVRSQEQAFKARRLKAPTSARCARCDMVPSTSKERQALVVDCQLAGRQAVAQTFLRSTVLPTPKQFVSHPRLNSKQFRPEDEDFADTWRSFYRTQGGLRLLCRPCAAAARAERDRAAAAAEHSRPE